MLLKMGIIKIRKAKESDMLTVYEQICKLEEIKLNINDFQNIYILNIRDESKLYFVAQDSMGLSLGFISCHIQYLLHHCGKVAEIQELYVNEKYRGLGIGKKLIDQVEQKLKELDCVYFEVTAQNKRLDTHEFYKKTGFHSTHLKFTKKIS